jgi:hypothetical protein
MFKSGMNTFALVINYANESWTLMHVIIDLFEVLNRKELSMAK